MSKARKPASKISKKTPAKASRRRSDAAAPAAETTQVDQMVEILAGLRTTVRRTVEEYLARVDGQIGTAIARLEQQAAKRPRPKRKVRAIEAELKTLDKVKARKGRLKDLARLEEAAAKIQDLLRPTQV